MLCVDERFHDGQPESGTTILPRRSSFNLLELSEYFLQVVVLHADTGVRNLETATDTIGLFERLHSELDETVMRELYGIAKQVVEDLPQTERVPAKGIVRRVFGIKDESQVLSLCLNTH